MKGLEKIQLFPKALMQKLAAELVGKIRYRTKIQGLDAKGNQLPPYKKSYIEALGKWTKHKNIPETLRGYSLNTTGAKISRRQFHLRGDGITMDGLQPRETSADSITIGWRDADAEVVELQKGKGRDVCSDLPESEKDFIINFLADNVEKQYQQKVRDMKITVTF